MGLRHFAKVIGVSPTFVSKMERGLGPLPGEKTICKMAEIFGKNPDALLAMADKVASDVLAVSLNSRHGRALLGSMRISLNGNVLCS